MAVGATKANWKLPIVVAIVCGVVVFAAGFLHRQAVDDAVAKQQARSAAIAKAMTKDVAGVDLTKAAKGHDEKALEKAVDPPAGTDLAIFSLDGVRVYATSGARTVIGVRSQIADAAKGTVSRTVDGEDLVVYAPIPSAKKGQLAVAAVVTSYQKLLDNASGPLDAARMPLTAIGVVLFLVGLALFLRGRTEAAPATERPAKEAKPGKAGKVGKQAKAGATASGEKGRVSGFDPVPVVDGPAPSPAAPTAEAEPAAAAAAVPSTTKASAAKRLSFGKKGKPEPAAEAAEGSKKRSLFGKKAAVAAVEAAPASQIDGDALQREVAIRQALEDQLEQLRTRMHTQEEQASAQIRELRDQLEAAQGTEPTPTVGPAEQDMIARIRSMETELSEARETAAQATAQVATMQQELATATGGGVSAAATEVEAQVRDLQAKLEEAERTASDSEQRAQSIESIRAELEVRVAQLSSKAGELEQKAEELETRLREANEGGDAVREEIASLTAALAAAEARGKELEASAATSGESEAEIARLRSELGKQMERAQKAEERVATLEADVLAAAHGIEALSDAPDPHEEAAPTPPEMSTPSRNQPPAEVVTPDIGTVAEEPVETASAAVEPTPEPRAEEPQELPVRQEWHPTTEVDVPEGAEETGHDEPAVAEAVIEPASADPVSSKDEDPPAPSGHDRYDDVWAAAFPTQSNGNGAESVPAEVEVEPAEPDTEPAAEPALASSATPSDDEASEPEATVSVEDDLWALRARLAHADDDDQERTPPAQSWS